MRYLTNFNSVAGTFAEDSKYMVIDQLDIHDLVLHILAS